MENFIGFILPPLVDWLNKNVQNSKARFAISAVVCLVVAVILNFDKVMYGSVKEVLESASLIFAQAQVAYKMFYEKSEMRKEMFGDDITKR